VFECFFERKSGRLFVVEFFLLNTEFICSNELSFCATCKNCHCELFCLFELIMIPWQQYINLKSWTHNTAVNNNNILVSSLTIKQGYQKDFNKFTQLTDLAFGEVSYFSLYKVFIEWQLNLGKICLKNISKQKKYPQWTKDAHLGMKGVWFRIGDIFSTAGYLTSLGSQSNRTRTCQS